MFFEKITIIGLGFMGASFALAAKKHNICKRIYGFGRSIDNLEKAKARKIIDDYSRDLRECCQDSDLIILATPVGVFLNIINEIKSYIKRGSLISDVGSIKGSLVYEIESALSENTYYVGSHPITGGEKSGAENANPDLFNNALCIVTPTEKTNSESLSLIKRLWGTLGCKIELMDPHKHDRIYAVISHLPHLAAYAIVNTVNDVDGNFIKFAGQGFKDTTRIAMSPPEIWRDISAYNRDNLLEMLTLLKQNLDKMENLLIKGDYKGLEEEFRRSKSLREKLK